MCRRTPCFTAHATPPWLACADLAQMAHTGGVTRLRVRSDVGGVEGDRRGAGAIDRLTARIGPAARIFTGALVRRRQLSIHIHWQRILARAGARHRIDVAGVIPRHEGLVGARSEHPRPRATRWLEMGRQPPGQPPARHGDPVIQYRKIEASLDRLDLVPGHLHQHRVELPPRERRQDRARR